MIQWLYKQWKAWKESEDSFKGYIFITSAMAVGVLFLLQPFGLDKNIPHKAFIILGYGVLTAIACVLANFITNLLFKNKRDFYAALNWETLFYTLLMNILMSIFICCYAAWVFAGNIVYGWFDKEGNFTLHAFWINLKASLSITVLIYLFWIFRRQNFQLKKQLKEAVTLNAILTERQRLREQENSTHDNSHISKEDFITLQGSTKECVSLLPSHLLYIEAEGNYVNVHYLNTDKSEQKKTLRCTIKQMENSFEAYPSIIRCHRAFLVNTNLVKHVIGNAQGYRLQLENCSDEVPVSRAYANAVCSLIEG